MSRDTSNGHHRGNQKCFCDPRLCRAACMSPRFVGTPLPLLSLKSMHQPGSIQENRNYSRYFEPRSNWLYSRSGKERRRRETGHEVIPEVRGANGLQGIPGPVLQVRCFCTTTPPKMTVEVCRRTAVTYHFLILMATL